MDIRRDIMFRTPVELPVSGNLIDYAAPILTLGSCFSDYIGRELEARLFRISVNPLGTMFNPASVFKSLERIAYRKLPDDEEYFCHQGLWRHYDFHSSLAAADRKEAIHRVNNAISTASALLSSGPKPPVLFITLGTSYVFSLADSGSIVSNCHKMPSALFHRKLMSVDEVTYYLRQCVNLAISVWPGSSVVFTVSPVRHTADGLHGNQISKSTLLLACERVINDNPQACCYFPAYEAVIDDLRDYRFYASDMAHPSDTAVNYVFELLRQSMMDKQSGLLSDTAIKIYRRIKHRHSNPDSEASRCFEAETQRLMAELQSSNPYMSSLYK